MPRNEPDENRPRSLRPITESEPDRDMKAALSFYAGAKAEKMEDFAAAVHFYRKARSMKPTDEKVWYFIHNNLGYSLNQLGQFIEGEKLCREAIEINSNTHNAHKNLGLALKGQGHYREAAECFVTATRIDPRDTRSLAILQGLLREQPQFESEFKTRHDECVELAMAALKKSK